MYCSQCGTELPDDSAFCHNCGARTAVEHTRGDRPIPAALVAESPPPVRIQEVALAVPEWVHAQLLPREVVLAKTSGGHADYFATDRRLLVFRSKSSPDILHYQGISVRFRRYGCLFHVWRLFAAACALAFAGLALVLIQDVEIEDVTIGPRWDLAAVCAAVAALMLVAAVVSRYGFYIVAVGDQTPKKAARRAGWCYRLERLRFAPRNAALGRFMRLVEDMAEAPAELSSGEEATGNWQRGSGAPVTLASIAGALVGAALMTLYVLSADAAPAVFTEEERIYVSIGALIIPAAIGCSMAAGLVAGLLANWRGGTAGSTAAGLVFGGVVMWLLYGITAQAPPVGLQPTPTGFTYTELDPSFILDAIAPCALAWAVSLGLGALAGWVGERLRG